MHQDIPYGVHGVNCPLETCSRCRCQVNTWTMLGETNSLIACSDCLVQFSKSLPGSLVRLWSTDYMGAAYANFCKIDPDSFRIKLRFVEETQKINPAEQRS